MIAVGVRMAAVGFGLSACGFSTTTDVATPPDQTDRAPTDSTATPDPPANPLEGIGKPEIVAEGFAFTEGPTWREADGVLLFTDIPNARIHQLDPADDTVTVYDPASNQANGLDTDVDGRLLVAEHQSRRVTRRNADGTVAESITAWDGKAFNSPNDLTVRSDGTVYFTDPPYGLDGRPREIDFNGVFRLPPGSSNPEVEWEGDANATRPNGIVLSPDESVLYLADTQGGVTAFDVATDGSLANPRTFSDQVFGGDGMAVDARGNLYVTSFAGVQVFAPDGTEWGTITLDDQPANCAFGDADARTLYMTARSRLYRVRLAQPGRY